MVTGKSKKTRIIEDLFNQRWDVSNGTLTNSVVTLSQVTDAIVSYNTVHRDDMSTRNVANFFKDFIRNRESANRNWPHSILSRGYTARQVTGDNQCFEFVPIRAGQFEPFPPNLILPPTENTPRQRIESTSLPLASRRLGRGDEPWLMQVLVRLRVIESHLAIFSAREFEQIDHLQMSVKLRGAEIDALYLGIERLESGSTSEVIICCEAKGRRDDILEDQVLQQTKAVFGMRAVTQSVVLPIAIKALRPSEVHVVEFDAVSRAAVSSIVSLTVASEAVFELIPTVPGIGI